MLILMRRIGETVVINNNIEITVLSISGNQIRLGFVAPDDVTIHREEIQMRINQEAEHERSTNK